MIKFYVPVFEVYPENSIWKYTVAAKTCSQAAEFVRIKGAYSEKKIKYVIVQVRNESYYDQLGVLIAETI